MAKKTTGVPKKNKTTTQPKKETKERRPRPGKPGKFTQELFDKICHDISTSSIGLVHICKKHGISTEAFYTWIDNDKKLLDKYTRAREMQADYLADEILAIADDGSNDLMTITKGDASYELENKEVTNRSKLRVEARKWLASKLKPKKYGDKIELSGDKENPIVHQVTGMEIK
jgi:hypothetical protein